MKLYPILEMDPLKKGSLKHYVNNFYSYTQFVHRANIINKNILFLIKNNRKINNCWRI